MRAVVYTRVSTDGQRAASHEDQARNCGRIADREALTIVRRFKDHGLSGTRSDRPQYQAMLRAAEGREFEVLLVDELSRFSRDVVESEKSARTLEFIGVRIITADGYDSQSKARKLHRGMKALINAEYIESIRHETHRGLEGKARSGQSVGGRSYGYRSEPIVVDGKVTGFSVVVVPEQARWVRWIFERYAEGRSPRKIAAELNARSVPSPGSTWKRTERRTDKKWLASTIHGAADRGSGILHNQLYVGVRIWNRSRRDVDPRDERKVFHRRPEDEHVRVPVPHLRILDDELWNRVRAREVWVKEKYGERVKKALARGIEGKREQALFARRGLRIAAKYPLSGLLKCYKCGASLVLSGSPQRYVCASHTNGGKAACANEFRICRTKVEDSVLAGFPKELARPEYEELFQKETKRLLAAAKGDPGAATGAKIKELEAKVANLTDAIADGALKSSPALASKLADLEAALDAAKRARVTTGVTRILPRALERYRKMVAELPATIRRDPIAGREALREVIGGPIALHPTRDGGVEAHVPLPAIAKLLNGGGALENMSSGSGGTLLEFPTIVSCLSFQALSAASAG